MAETNASTGGAPLSGTTSSSTASHDSSGTPSSGRQPQPDGSSGIVNRVKESATAQLTNQKDRGTDALGSVAQAVRSSTQRLRDEQHDTIAGYVDKAADQIESWSRRLKEKDIDELLTDVQRLARRQPAVFIGSAFALGLVGARFLKSSRQQDDYGYGSESRRGMYGEQTQMSTASDRGAWTRGDAGAAVVIEEVSISDIESSGPTASTTNRSDRSRKSGARTERS
jgi:hypothetical protein